VGRLLVLAFILGLVGIELKRRGLMPEPLASITPNQHYDAIGLAFTLVLVLEVMSLIFLLPCSFSRSVGKQLEILALILLRNSFKELTYFPEPIDLGATLEPVYYILSDAAGALVIFVFLGIYHRLHRSRDDVLLEGTDIYPFVAVKKLISLGLLATFVGSALYDLWLFASGGKPYDFFETFYTVLIFTDVLIVLISQQFLPAFHAVFRNSGYALGTLLMRLALTAPQYVDAILGATAAGFAVLLTLACNTFSPAFEDKDSRKVNVAPEELMEDIEEP
jgi:hypothetical protein